MSNQCVTGDMEKEGASMEASRSQACNFALDMQREMQALADQQGEEVKQVANFTANFRATLAKTLLKYSGWKHSERVFAFPDGSQAIWGDSSFEIRD